MTSRTQKQLVVMAALFFAMWIVQKVVLEPRTVETLPYSEFKTLVRQGAIATAVVDGESIEGTYTRARHGKHLFVTRQIPSDIARTLDEGHVRYERSSGGGAWAFVVTWLLPFLPLVFLWYVFVRGRAAQGPGAELVSIGKSSAKVYVVDDTKVTFADVAGVDEAKQELEEVVEFLKDPKSSGRLGARLPRGVLLVGPPGTGKTLLARAVAGEAGVPFFSISGSEFVEMFVGVGAARVRDLFLRARERAPCIVFIDELDALGRARAGNAVFGHDEKEQTLNQLLVEMDGFDPKSGIVLLAATNRPEILDPALLRAGRFDRQVLVDRPDRKGRVDILRVHVKKVSLDAGVSLEDVAALTPGFSGADLANLVNEAALAATRRGGESVTSSDFLVAIERIVAGLERRNRLLNPREREIVAHHEMGHALVAATQPGSDVVHKVSIIPRGVGALGYTIHRPTEDRYLMTSDELEQKLMVLLGGRAAEKLAFGHLSTGATDDLVRATDIARSMVTRYAMVPELGNVTYDSEPTRMLGDAAPPALVRAYSETTAREIDTAIRKIVDAAFARTLTLLEQNKVILLEGARALLEHETLDATALAPFFARMRAATG